MERRFEIGLPVQIVHSHWEDFKRDEHSPARLEMEPAGGDSTRVRLLAPENCDAEALDALAAEFRLHLEARGEGAGLPLVGPMVSPGAPNAGMNDAAGRDVFPPGAPR